MRERVPHVQTENTRVARFVDAIDLPIPIEEAFDYLADFSRTAEWDPGVVTAKSLTKVPEGLGSRFEVTVAFLGQRMPLEYEITEFERPHRLVLTAVDGALRSVDEISFAERHGATRVTYEARIELEGVRRIADPVLDVLIQRVGRIAVRGLRERIAQREKKASKRHSEAAPRKTSKAAGKRAASRKTSSANSRRNSESQPNS